MAEALKDQFGRDVYKKISASIVVAHPSFDTKRFMQMAGKGFEALELTQRALHITRALRAYLPKNYKAAMKILLASLGPRLEKTDSFGMEPFLYLPHVLFVSEYGLDDFELSMKAQYELTQRFSAEFSIRFFLEQYPEKTLARLRVWATDSNPHVRRLVSEGTRPRLPWARRLKRFQKDPRPVLLLLELLKDDPELYVRRSVANNLNDIGKDNPDLLFKTTRRWMKAATQECDWLVRHALRSSIKRGERGAFDVLGYANPKSIDIGKVRIAPKTAKIGGCVSIWLELSNNSAKPYPLIVDFCVNFVKANGKTSPKVFKLKTFNIGAKETIALSKSISLKKMTTRKLYRGTHTVDMIVNGCQTRVGQFELRE